MQHHFFRYRKKSFVPVAFLVNPVRFVEAVLCLGCFALALYLVIDVIILHIAFKVMLAVTAAAFAAITLIDVISTSQYNPIDWNSWVLFATTGAITFILCAGTLLATATGLLTILVIGEVIFGVTGIFFLIDACFLMCMMKKQQIEVGPDKEDGKEAEGVSVMTRQSDESRDREDKKKFKKQGENERKRDSQGDTEGGTERKNESEKGAGRERKSGGDTEGGRERKSKSEKGAGREKKSEGDIDIDIDGGRERKSKSDKQKEGKEGDKETIKDNENGKEKNAPNVIVQRKSKDSGRKISKRDKDKEKDTEKDKEKDINKDKDKETDIDKEQDEDKSTDNDIDAETDQNKEKENDVNREEDKDKNGDTVKKNKQINVSDSETDDESELEISTTERSESSSDIFSLDSKAGQDERSQPEKGTNRQMMGKREGRSQQQDARNRQIMVGPNGKPQLQDGTSLTPVRDVEGSIFYQAPNGMLYTTDGTPICPAKVTLTPCPVGPCGPCAPCASKRDTKEKKDPCSPCTSKRERTRLTDSNRDRSRDRTRERPKPCPTAPCSPCAQNREHKRKEKAPSPVSPGVPSKQSEFKSYPGGPRGPGTPGGKPCPTAPCGPCTPCQKDEKQAKPPCPVGPCGPRAPCEGEKQAKPPCPVGPCGPYGPCAGDKSSKQLRPVGPGGPYASNETDEEEPSQPLPCPVGPCSPCSPCYGYGQRCPRAPCSRCAPCGPERTVAQVHIERRIFDQGGMAIQSIRSTESVENATRTSRTVAISTRMVPKVCPERARCQSAPYSPAAVNESQKRQIKSADDAQGGSTIYQQQSPSVVYQQYYQRPCSCGKTHYQTATTVQGTLATNSCPCPYGQQQRQSSSYPPGSGSPDRNTESPKQLEEKLPQKLHSCACAEGKQYKSDTSQQKVLCGCSKGFQKLAFKDRAEVEVCLPPQQLQTISEREGETESTSCEPQSQTMEDVSSSQLASENAEDFSSCEKFCGTCGNKDCSIHKQAKCSGIQSSTSPPTTGTSFSTPTTGTDEVQTSETRMIRARDLQQFKQNQNLPGSTDRFCQ